MEIVVYQPEIAGNVGAIIRLSANSGIPVNFIKPFGFNMQENKIRRAGLDYQDLAFVKNYESWIDFIDSNKNKSIACLSSKGDKEYWNEELNNFDFKSNTNNSYNSIPKTIFLKGKSIIKEDLVINKHETLDLSLIHI